MQIIAVRHAPTEYNEKELINGRIDEPLSAAGINQIPGLIDSLKAYKFDVIYASTMQRSLQTSQPVAAHYGVPLHEDARLIEVGLGSFEGKPWAATIPYFGTNSSGLLSSCRYDLRRFGGESSDEVQARLQSFLNDLKRQPNQKPLIFAHGGIMRMLHYICTGETTGRIANLAVQIFTI